MVSPQSEVEITFNRRYQSSVGTWEEGDNVRLTLENACLINRDSPGTFGEDESKVLETWDAELRGIPDAPNYAFLHEDSSVPIGDLSGYLHPVAVSDQVKVIQTEESTPPAIDLTAYIAEGVDAVKNVSDQLEQDLNLDPDQQTDNTGENPESDETGDLNAKSDADSDPEGTEEKQDPSEDKTEDESNQRELKTPGSHRQVTKPGKSR